MPRLAQLKLGWSGVGAVPEPLDGKHASGRTESATAKGTGAALGGGGGLHEGGGGGLHEGGGGMWPELGEADEAGRVPCSLLSSPTGDDKVESLHVTAAVASLHAAGKPSNPLREPKQVEHSPLVGNEQVPTYVEHNHDDDEHKGGLWALHGRLSSAALNLTAPSPLREAG